MQKNLRSSVFGNGTKLILNSWKISWRVENFSLQTKKDLLVLWIWTKKWIFPPPTSKSEIRDFSTQKPSNLQSQMVTNVPSLKVIQTNWFVGLHAKEFKIKRAWKDVTMCTVRQSVFTFQDLLSFAFSFLNSRRISERMKKDCTKTKLMIFLQATIQVFVWR